MFELDAVSDKAKGPQTFRFCVTDRESGQRLDVYLAAQLPRCSRVQLRRVINAARVQVDGQQRKAAYHIREGQQIDVELPEVPRDGPVPENVPLEILFEDESFVAINKPSGMIVHPSKGHWQGTLTNALAFHFQNLSTVGGPARPGIVHRLDRETSGVIVAAKTDTVHLALARQFEKRTVEKEYFAIVQGVPDRDRDIVNQPIGVHPYQREKMAIRAGHGTSRDASTLYEVRQRYHNFAMMNIFPKTGRTHQIRVHMAHIGCPVLCDRLYGGRARITHAELSGERALDDDSDMALERLALHAHRLSIEHPAKQVRMEFIAPLPPDLMRVVEALNGET